MRFSEELLQHATKLLGNPPEPSSEGVGRVDLRRAVSAAYYAVFHRLSEATVEQIAPYAPPPTANRIHRWLDHTEMKKVCGEFAAANLRPPLRDLLGNSASTDMQTVAIALIKLQTARHSADYDLEYQLSWAQTERFIAMAAKAIDAWQRLDPSAESNVFVISLLLWKKWEVVRQ